MTILTHAPSEALQSLQLELNNGDRMNREEFHRAYSQAPEDFRAELIGGIVHLASPLKRRHGVPHLALGSILFGYSAGTPGTEAGDNVTIILGQDSEPQPDLYLRILPQFGGQSSTTDDDYVKGAPEFVAEVAMSSRAIDLHAKRNDYHRYGVREYLVVSIRDQQLHWFDLREDRELQPGPDKILRIGCFPGLWIDGDALLTGDDTRLLATLQRGLASVEHAAFINTLAAARK